MTQTLSIKQAADQFVKWRNNELEKINNTNSQISDTLPIVYLRKNPSNFRMIK